MGSNFAVVYACLFLCYLEHLLSLTTLLPSMLYFKMFVDDVLGIWLGPLSDLTSLLNRYGQSFQKIIKITHSISSNQATILDIVFFKGPSFSSSGILDTHCHKKALNSYNYIPWCSWHSTHQKISFILSELKRFIVRENSLSGFLTPR